MCSTGLLIRYGLSHVMRLLQCFARVLTRQRLRGARGYTVLNDSALFDVTSFLLDRHFVQLIWVNSSYS